MACSSKPLSRVALEPDQARDRLRSWLDRPDRQPLDSTTESLLRGLTDAALDTAKPNSTGSRVLIVDDVPLNRKLLRALLEARGMQVTEAENGLEAVRLYAAERFVLVLMDLRMPVMDGLVATQAIRLLEMQVGLQPVTILAVTAEPRAQVLDTCGAAGLNGIYEKPILITHIDQMLRAASL